MHPLRERPRTPASRPYADPAPAILAALAAREAGLDPSDPAWRAGALRRAEAQLDRAVGPCGRRLALGALEHARGLMPPPADTAERTLSALAGVLFLASWLVAYVAVVPPDAPQPHLHVAAAAVLR